MKKKYIFVVIVTLLIMLLSGTILFLNGDKSHALMLDDLKQDEEYQLGEIAWNMSKKEVEKGLQVSLCEDPRRTSAPSGIEFYTSEEQFFLNNKIIMPSFEFHADELKMVQFYCDVDMDSEKWFEQLVAEITRLYGTATDMFENSKEEHRSVGYKWNADSSSLQILYIAENTSHSQIVISLGLRKP